MESFTKILEVLENAKDDVEKFSNGNKSAGTRVRKAMQEVKTLAQSVRVEVQESKKNG
tara:strand:- start:1201 stop:1374 length:174 start_codon:yes stop_codon:yes gene_type:complete